MARELSKRLQEIIAICSEISVTQLTIDCINAHGSRTRAISYCADLIRWRALENKKSPTTSAILEELLNLPIDYFTPEQLKAMKTWELFGGD